jgi:hypothetical protein
MGFELKTISIKRILVGYNICNIRGINKKLLVEERMRKFSIIKIL